MLDISLTVFIYSEGVSGCGWFCKKQVMVSFDAFGIGFANLSGAYGRRWSVGECP